MKKIKTSYHGIGGRKTSSQKLSYNINNFFMKLGKAKHLLLNLKIYIGHTTLVCLILLCGWSPKFLICAQPFT